jgi:hypothetical protein
LSSVLATGREDADRPGIERADQQVQLGDEAGDRRGADHAQRGQGEGAEGPRHRAAEAAHLGDVLLVGGDVDRAGAEEEGDLGEGVVGDVDQAALDGGRA